MSSFLSNINKVETSSEYLSQVTSTISSVPSEAPRTNLDCSGSDSCAVSKQFQSELPTKSDDANLLEDAEKVEASEIAEDRIDETESDKPCFHNLRKRKTITSHENLLPKGKVIKLLELNSAMRSIAVEKRGGYMCLYCANNRYFESYKTVFSHFRSQHVRRLCRLCHKQFSTRTSEAKMENHFEHVHRLTSSESAQFQNLFCIV